MAEQKQRVFKYGDQSWEDPGEGFSNEDVRQQLVNVFPELSRADIVATDLPDGRQQVEFVKRAGTKGTTGTTEALLDRFLDALWEAVKGERRGALRETIRWTLDRAGLDFVEREPSSDVPGAEV